MSSQGLEQFSNSILGFLKLAMTLKVSERRGWVYKGVEKCESIADHSYRMATMSFFLDSKAYDVNKVIKLSLVHDMAECIVGDITPHCGVTKEDKL